MVLRWPAPLQAAQVRHWPQEHLVGHAASAVSHQLYPIKPQLVVKHAVPAAFRLLEENRTDTRAGTVLLLRTLYAAMGDVLFEHAMKIPPNTQQRLHELIQVRDTTL